MTYKVSRLEWDVKPLLVTHYSIACILCGLKFTCSTDAFANTDVPRVNIVSDCYSGDQHVKAVGHSRRRRGGVNTTKRSTDTAEDSTKLRGNREKKQRQ